MTEEEMLKVPAQGEPIRAVDFYCALLGYAHSQFMAVPGLGFSLSGLTPAQENRIREALAGMHTRDAKALYNDLTQGENKARLFITTENIDALARFNMTQEGERPVYRLRDDSIETQLQRSAVAQEELREMRREG